MPPRLAPVLFAELTRPNPDVRRSKRPPRIRSCATQALFASMRLGGSEVRPAAADNQQTPSSGQQDSSGEPKPRPTPNVLGILALGVAIIGFSVFVANALLDYKSPPQISE